MLIFWSVENDCVIVVIKFIMIFEIWVDFLINGDIDSVFCVIILNLNDNLI